MYVYNEHPALLSVFTQAGVTIYHTGTEPQRNKLFRESSQGKRGFR